MNKKQGAKIKAYKNGLYAEYLAEALLRLKGYRILARRYKTPVGEIDLIVHRRGALVAVEVKNRAGQEDALYAINPQNRARVQRALEHYIARHPHYSAHDLRFDVVIVSRGFSVRHLDNAWQACS